MFRLLSILLLLLSTLVTINAQTQLPVIGIAETTLAAGIKGERFTENFTKTITETAKSTERFRVVDRSDYDEIIKELELQKREEFIDAEGTVDKDSRIGVPTLVTSTIVKMPFERMRNYDGSVRGYRASVTISIGLQNVESSVNYSTKTFTASPNNEYISTDAAIDECCKILASQIFDYLKNVKLQE